MPGDSGSNASSGAWANYRAGQATANMHALSSGGGGGGFGGYGYGGGGRGNRKFGGDFRRGGPEQINWNGENIVPITKEFWAEHPMVVDRAREESEQIRLKHSINVTMRDGSEPPKPIESLEELPFPDWALEVLHTKGFKDPTPIQVQAWPAALKGHDIIGIAETGSGKTLAYVLPMLMHIMAQPEVRPGEGAVGLVLLPNRELCYQVAEDILRFAVHTPLTCESVTGGEDEYEQIKKLKQSRVDILVATPGRLISLLNSKDTNLRRATFVVLDEADDLFTSTFADQVQLVISQVRPDRQVLLFSATWGDKVEETASTICKCNPIQIVVGSTKLAACKDIVQTMVLAGHPQHSFIPNATKMQMLLHSLQRVQDSKVLIFCNKKERVPQVVADLQREGWPCEGFSGGLYKQETRQALLKRFADPQGDLKTLVCTQVLGRGHDFRDVSFVINYDMPWRMVEYVHRIGRTGRAGRQGFALTILEEDDLWIAKELVSCLNQTNQDVPPWLSDAAKKGRKKVFKHRAVTGPGYNADDMWVGRGKGRRGEVLHRLNGRGAAKGPLVIQVPPYHPQPGAPYHPQSGAPAAPPLVGFGGAAYPAYR